MQSRDFTNTAQGAPSAPKVYCLGQIWIEEMMHIKDFPEHGGFVAADQSITAVSGSYPIAVAAQSMGIPATIVSPIGTGPCAQAIEHRLNESKITRLGPVHDHRDSGFRMIVNDDEQKTYFAKFGVENEAPVDLYDVITPQLGDIVHILGPALFRDTGLSTLRFLKRPECQVNARHFMLVVTPTSRVDLLSDDMLQALEEAQPLWSMNRQEGLALAEHLDLHLDNSKSMLVSGGFDELMEELCTKLSERLRTSVVLRAGSRGVWISSNGSLATHVPGFETKATHTRSAGPCHTGALCAMLAQGKSLLESAQIANAAASLAIYNNQYGVPTSPTLEQVQAFIAEQATQASSK
ncbi:kinase, PfkB family [Bifidobacterium dolichotidis]|uniref:Kinase, PfkB family n=1 Tax=Bifidobacterium dolichotidis TaxID=2306976 RepID=A0A430FQK4_9BIFI|nr:PfkB family carbohydrate kinase [Bifidobacterium dolichotidis]RSX55111.1 kinase, PfkB family [Bifidobacterium dolichotidis]